MDELNAKKSAVVAADAAFHGAPSPMTPEKAAREIGTRDGGYRTALGNAAGHARAELSGAADYRTPGKFFTGSNPTPDELRFVAAGMSARADDSSGGMDYRRIVADAERQMERRFYERQATDFFIGAAADAGRSRVAGWNALARPFGRAAVAAGEWEAKTVASAVYQLQARSAASD